MIFLQVIIDRKKTKIDLDISWPPERFKDSLCNRRFKDDPDYNEYNIIIENARAKANNINKDYLLRGIKLNLESFIKEYRSNLNKADFIQYFAQKSFERWNKGIISDDTYEKEKGTLSKLKSFSPIIPFHEFHADWAQLFDKHLKKEFKNEINGRWNRHKHIKTYLSIAKGPDRISFIDPYSRFKNILTDSKWKPLELGQMKTLLEKYIEWKDKPLPIIYKKDERKGLSVSDVIVLRRFLFSCNCALRISDLQKLDRSMFSNGEMSITPKKTKQYGTTIDSVPLNDIARMMLDDELRDNPNFKVFDRYTDQYSNRALKRIADKVAFKFNLHNHVARYTFASLMDQAGANHTGLMKYMGLRKRDTLEKYVKTNKKVISADIGKMNAMISEKDEVKNLETKE